MVIGRVAHIVSSKCAGTAEAKDTKGKTGGASKTKIYKQRLPKLSSKVGELVINADK